MSGNKANPTEDAKRLLTHLRQLKNDRGAMAELRCTLSTRQGLACLAITGAYWGHRQSSHRNYCRFICAPSKRNHDGQSRHDLPPTEGAA